MARHIFKHWEAIELFARIIQKREGGPLEKYYDYYVLHELIKEACRDKYSSEITKTINSIPANSLNEKKGTVKSLSGKDISSLANSIENRTPFTISDANFDIIKNYVGEADFFKRIKHTKKFEVSDKRMKYEGTVWNLYFYDRTNEKEAGPKPVINRAVLKFLPFSKVEITYYNTDTCQPDDYIGTFLNSEGGDYFILEMKTKIGGHKDLKIQIYTGQHSNVVPIAVGIFSNSSHLMEAGSVIIERVAENKEVTDNKEVFIKTYELDNEEDRSALGKDHIWKFFSETKSYISLPIGLNSPAKILDWLTNRPK